MPWTNDDIKQLMGLLTEIRDSLKPPDLSEIDVAELFKPKKKMGRPKGSKNVKRGGKGLGKVRRQVPHKRPEGDS